MSAGIPLVELPGSVPAVVPGSLSVPVIVTAPVVPEVVAVTPPVVAVVPPVTLSLTEPALDSPSDALPVGVSCVVEPSLAVAVTVTVAVTVAVSEARPSSLPPHADNRPAVITPTKLMFVRCMVRLLMLTATLAGNPSHKRGNPPARSRVFSRPTGRSRARATA